jgi:hypothetical protein
MTKDICEELNEAAERRFTPFPEIATDDIIEELSAESEGALYPGWVVRSLIKRIEQEREWILKQAEDIMTLGLIAGRSIEPHTIRCTNCDYEFISKREDKKYCSDRCRMQAMRKRQNKSA